ncbi:unnamed protein product [Allacma fusca]|uniref:C-type lectin domain-containing protein n=1 Tax=Allacma fusca TaxID=39272 RepID=A0A8J2KL19_9HEXA|nr:unnamed protein product [Allacma fusca]
MCMTNFQFFQVRVVSAVLFLFYFLHVVQSTGRKDATGADVGTKKELVGVYSIYRKILSWGDAAIFCEKHEGHLATFVNMKDAQDVIDAIYKMSEPVSNEYLSGAKIAEFGLDRRYWIALTDLVSGEGHWVWAGKGVPLTYNLWYPGQPDHIDKDGKYIGRPEHCVALWNPIFHKGDRKHSFVDQECKRLYYFICEKDEKKLEQQKDWADKNKDRVDLYDGRSLSSLLFRGREREHHNNSQSVSQAQGRGLPLALPISGRNINNLIPRPGSDPKKQSKKVEWAKEEGFKEIFEPSESSSIEENTKQSSIVKTETKSTTYDEVADVFSL